MSKKKVKRCTTEKGKREEQQVEEGEVILLIVIFVLIDWLIQLAYIFNKIIHKREVYLNTFEHTNTKLSRHLKEN